MKNALHLLILPLVLAAPAPALSSAPGGALGTLQIGYYVCEQPGDATGPVGYRVGREEFRIVTGSSYWTAVGRGTYLLTGDMVTMTSGPKNGQKFRRISESSLRQIVDGAETGLRCVRRNRNND